MDGQLIDAVREFTRTILNPYDLDDLLDRLVDRVTEALRAAGAGIMLESRAGALQFAAASGASVREVELVQDHAGTGACHEAFVTNQIVVVGDLRSAGRWPGYTERAVSLGLLAVIGVPLHAWGRTIGVLNVYRNSAGEWTADDVEACEILAGLGAGYILNATQMQAQHELTENLQAALNSRGIIERAKGILMEREGVDADTAFKALRQASMDSNRKLREIAQDLVHRAERP